MSDRDAPLEAAHSLRCVRLARQPDPALTHLGSSTRLLMLRA
jgi:hypothetical protein